MIRLLFILFFSITFLLSSDIAIVKKSMGEVFAKRTNVLVNINVGDQLHIGDVLITKTKSSIGVIFHDGSVLSLGENSILSIDDYIFKPIENESIRDICNWWWIPKEKIPDAFETTFKKIYGDNWKIVKNQTETRVKYAEKKHKKNKKT